MKDAHSQRVLEESARALDDDDDDLFANCAFIMSCLRSFIIPCRYTDYCGTAATAVDQGGTENPTAETTAAHAERLTWRDYLCSETSTRR